MPLPTPPLHSPLTALAEAFAFLDASLQSELERTARTPACGPGCYACCLQPIPLSLAEVMGIKAFLKEHDPIPHSPTGGRKGDPDGGGGRGSLDRCPFLHEGGCLIYPVRPFACRRYLVFGRPCAKGEEPLQSRPQDVHRPSQAALLHALNMTLPLYDAAGLPHGRREDRDFFTRHTALIQQIQWDG